MSDGIPNFVSVSVMCLAHSGIYSRAAMRYISPALLAMWGIFTLGPIGSILAGCEQNIRVILEYFTVYFGRRRRGYVADWFFAGPFHLWFRGSFQLIRFPM